MPRQSHTAHQFLISCGTVALPSYTAAGSSAVLPVNSSAPHTWGGVELRCGVGWGGCGAGWVGWGEVAWSHGVVGWSAVRGGVGWNWVRAGGASRRCGRRCCHRHNALPATTRRATCPINLNARCKDGEASTRQDFGTGAQTFRTTLQVCDMAPGINPTLKINLPCHSNL